jgi:sarcosine oxidase subunit gamma
VSAPEPSSRFVGSSLPERGGASGGAAVTITELSMTLVQVIARKEREEALCAAIVQELGLALPASGRTATKGDYIALWQQPRCWLIQAPAASAITMRLAEALAGIAAVVDQSHGRVVLRVSGAQSRAVLAKICRLDLHPRSFAPGATAATLVGHVPCTMRLIDEAPTFDLIVGSSFATWLLEELVEAADDCGWHLVRAGKAKAT